MRVVRVSFLALLSVWVGGCDGDETQSANAPDPTKAPTLRGPFSEALDLGPQSRTSLPPPEVPHDATRAAHFFWWHPSAKGRRLQLSLIAVSATPLELGAVIHEQQVQVPRGRAQGQVRLHPAMFSTGGAKRTAGGDHRWVPGVYRLQATLGGQSFGDLSFDVT